MMAIAKDSPSVLLLGNQSEDMTRLMGALSNEDFRVSLIDPPPYAQEPAAIAGADALVACFSTLDAVAGDAVATLSEMGTAPLIVLSHSISQESELGMLRLGAQEVVEARRDEASTIVCARLCAAVLRSIQRHRYLQSAEGAKRSKRMADIHEMMDMFPVAVLMADWNGHLRIANSQAQSLLADHDAIFVDPLGNVRLTDKQQNTQLYEIIERVHAGIDTDCALAAPRQSGLAPMSILVVPVGQGTDDAERGVTLFISVPEDPFEIAPARLEGLYGFTPAEAKLVISLVAGSKLDEIAEESGTSLNTLRNHLKSVFRKTDTNRQAELMKRVLTGPAVFRSRPSLP